MIAILNRILRSPEDVAEACKREIELRSLARACILTLVMATALFGAVAGSWHGGWQIAFAAFKMPLVLVATLALSAPAFYAFASVFGRAWTLRSILSLSLVAGARFALVLVALTPALWLIIDIGAGYHAVKICATGAYALAGLGGLTVLVRGLGDGPGKRGMILLMVGVFLLVGAQNAWVMRPYLVEPGAADVSLFMRKREGGLVLQLWKSVSRLLVHGSERDIP